MAHLARTIQDVPLCQNERQPESCGNTPLRRHRSSCHHGCPGCRRNTGPTYYPPRYQQRCPGRLCKNALAAPCCGHTRENADLKAISYLYASLGDEGKRRLHQRLAELCPAVMFMCDLLQELDNIFHKQRNILVESVKFLSRRQLPNETMQDYFAALSELTAKSEFEHQLAPTWIRDVFVTNHRDLELQRQFITKMTAPGDILQETITYELGLMNQKTIRKALPPTTTSATPSTTAEKPPPADAEPTIKSEPVDVLAVKNRTGNSGAAPKTRRVNTRPLPTAPSTPSPRVGPSTAQMYVPRPGG